MYISCIAGLRKGRRTRDQIANIHWITKKARGLHKTSTSVSLTMLKPFDCVDHNKLRKILKEMGITNYVTCLLRNPYAVKKQQLEPDMEQWTGSKLRKEYDKAVYCDPAYLTYMQST